ncbi:MAG: hypothetical protein DHS20C01_28130 [marine bacterium B5-7]|nr:MAG: hypothetical protein DHS20C01_28130 [marine bacterium B5-7]
MSARIDASAARRLVEVCCDTYPGFDGGWRSEIERLTRLGEIRRVARYIGDQGVIITPRDGNDRLFFTPASVTRGPAPSSGWLPDAMQNFEALSPLALDESRRRVDKVLDAAFLDRDAHHAAVLVAWHGHLIGECYADGFDADMPLESWSMGKTILSALVGQLVGRGALVLDAPAPVGVWRSPGDPRGGITLRHLLNMSSGLSCSGMEQPRQDWNGALPDHFMPYASAIDVARYATDRPAEHPPATVGRYRNCDPLALSLILHDTVRNVLREDPLAWPQTSLFDRIGMRGLIHETDRYGRFIITGFNYGSARDWARFGHLYLHNGLWNGERILPAGWVGFSRTPAPAWPEADYGAQLWINTNRAFPLPPDAFYLYGGGGQYVFVVPGDNIVIVRQGHSRGWAGAKVNVERLLSKIMTALGRT